MSSGVYASITAQVSVAPGSDAHAAPAAAAPSLVPARSLRSNFSWTLAGTGVSAGAKWALLIVLARLGGSEEVGLYSLALAIIGPIIALANCAIASSLVTDRSEGFSYRPYMGFRLISTAMALLAAAAIASVAADSFMQLSVIILVAAGSCVQVVREIHFAVLQRIERMDVSGRSLLAEGVFSVALAAGVYRLSGSLAATVAALAACKLAFLLAIDSPASRRHSGADLRPAFAPGKLAGLAMASLPLSLYLAVGAASLNLPRYFLMSSRGSAMLGEFTCVTSFMAASGLIGTALGNTAVARLSKLWGVQPQAFLHTSLKLMAVAAAVGLAGIAVSAVAGGWLLEVMFGGDFGRLHAHLVVASISMAMMLLTSVAQSPLVASRAFGQLLAMGFITICSGAGIYWYAVGAYGLWGALWGQVVVSGLWLGLVMMAFWRRGGRSAPASNVHVRRYVFMHFWPVSGGFEHRFNKLAEELRSQGAAVETVSCWRQLPQLALSRLGPDVRLVVHCSLSAPAVLLVKALHPGLTICYMVRGDEITWALFARRRLRALVALAMQRLMRRLGCRFVFVSRDLHHLFVRRLGPIADARLMPNTLGKKIGSIRPFDGRLAVVGDFSSVKNIEAILDDLGEGQFQVDLYGNTSLPDRYRLDWIRSHGPVTDLRQRLENSSLVVLASVSEGFPNVLLDALSAGCGVILKRGWPFAHLPISDAWRFEPGRRLPDGRSELETLVAALSEPGRSFQAENPDIISLAAEDWGQHVRRAME